MYTTSRSHGRFPSIQHQTAKIAINNLRQCNLVYVFSSDFFRFLLFFNHLLASSLTSSALYYCTVSKLDNLERKHQLYPEFEKHGIVWPCNFASYVDGQEHLRPSSLRIISSLSVAGKPFHDSSQPLRTYGLVCLRLPLQPSERWLILAFANHQFYVTNSNAPPNFQARQKVHLLRKHSLSLAKDKICKSENRNDMRSLEPTFSAFGGGGVIASVLFLKRERHWPAKYCVVRSKMYISGALRPFPCKIFLPLPP